MGDAGRRMVALVGLATVALIAAVGPGLASASRTPLPQPSTVRTAIDLSTTSLAAGGAHGCALPGDGTVLCWGNNFFGQLGNGLKTDPTDPTGDSLPPPVEVIAGAGSAEPLTGAIALAAGESHTCALLDDTTVRCWGANAATPDGGPFGPAARSGGQLGDGTTIDRLAPVPVVAVGGGGFLSGVTAISAGGDHTCALLDDQSVSCWGNAPQVAGLLPSPVMRDASSVLTGVAAISAGDQHACALLDDETVVCWGVNFLGQLGDQSTNPSTYPVQVTIEDGGVLSGVQSIAAGHGTSVPPNGIATGHTCAVVDDGTVTCWGVNDVSQLGNGESTTPDGQPWAGLVVAARGSAEPLAGAIALAAGWAHACSLGSTGEVHCWGISFGEPRGDPSGFQGSGAPVRIVSGAVAIAAGGQSCAVLEDGSVVCWIGSAQEPYVIPGLVVQPEPAPTPTAAAASEPPAATEPATTTAPQSSPDGAGGGPVASAAPGPLAAVAVSFQRSVPRLADITLDALILAQSFVIAAAILLLMPFPGALFNNTLEANYEEITARLRAGRRWPLKQLRSAVSAVGRPPAGGDPAEPSAAAVAGMGATPRGTEPAPPASPPGPFWQSPLGIALFLLVTAVLITFLDPTFWSATTAAASFAGLTIGLVVMLVVFNLPNFVAYRSSNTSFVIRALPGTILIGLACALISRLTDFQPGYLYGLVVGLVAVKGSQPDADNQRRAEGRRAALGTVLTLAVAIGAWLVLGLVTSDPSTGLGASTSIALEAALATMVVAGFEGAALGALPLRFFAGDKMRQWSWPVWLVLGALAGGLFLHIIINPSSGYLADSTRTPIATIVGLLVLFGLGSVLFWAYFRFRPEPGAAPT